MECFCLLGEHSVVGPFTEDLWFTGWFNGQTYFLLGLVHPVVSPFAIAVVADDLIANWTA